MIDLTHDTIHKKIQNAKDFANESPTTLYAESHKHLVKLYLDYLLRNYPTKTNDVVK